MANEFMRRAKEKFTFHYGLIKTGYYFNTYFSLPRLKNFVDLLKTPKVSCSKNDFYFLILLNTLFFLV